MEIIQCLENNSLVQSFEIIDFKDFGNGYYFKIKVILLDDSEIFISEYIDSSERNYSYHWQTKNSELIKRWDNAPHYKEIKTYPHHTHYQNSVYQNYSITCTEIFKEISEIIKNIKS